MTTKLPRILMCSPAHYTVEYAINPWMEGPEGVDRQRALAQWKRLRDALSEHARIETIEPGVGLPDMPYTANAGTLRGNLFVPSRFRHPQRRGEESLFAAWFEKHGYQVLMLPEGMISEGAGDVLFDTTGERLWMGYGPRSDREAAAFLGTSYDVEPVALRLVDPRFYHLDTCFAPLPGGYFMYYPQAFDAEGLRAIEARVPAARRILVTEDEACSFACNIVPVGQHVFLHAVSPQLQRRLRAAGLVPHAVALDEFIKGGGSAKCLTLRLDTPSVTPRRTERPEWQATA